MARVGSVVIRIDDIERQAQVWSNALHDTRQIDRHDFILLSPRGGNGPNISRDTMRSTVQRPPRIHLDLNAEDATDEVQRLVGLGAAEVHGEKRPSQADDVILSDPEGNHVCVVDTRRWPPPVPARRLAM